MSYVPKLYTALHLGNPGDTDFYVGCCAEADSVLELGCGDGRVLFELARTARRAVGIEPNAAMRAVANERRKSLPYGDRISVVDGDMRTFDLGARFDRIVIPYSGIFCLPDDAAIVSTFERIRAHLEPEGALAFDAYHVVGAPPPGPDAEAEYVTTLEIDGAEVDVYEQDEHWPERRDCAVTYTYHLPQGVVPQVLRHHYVYAEALPDLLSQGGLSLRALWGGFGGEPLDEDADQMVVVAVPV